MGLAVANGVRRRDGQPAAPSGLAGSAAGGFFLGLMPKKNRTTFNRLTGSSYKTSIKVKEIPATMRSLGRMPMFQRMTKKPTTRMTV